MRRRLLLLIQFVPDWLWRSTGRCASGGAHLVLRAPPAPFLATSATLSGPAELKVYWPVSPTTTLDEPTVPVNCWERGTAHPVSQGPQGNSLGGLAHICFQSRPEVSAATLQTGGRIFMESPVGLPRRRARSSRLDVRVICFMLPVRKRPGSGLRLHLLPKHTASARVVPVRCKFVCLDGRLPRQSNPPPPLPLDQ